MTFRCFHGLFRNIGRRFRQGAEDTARVKPAGALFAENTFPIDLAGLELRNGSMSAVGTSGRPSHSESTIDKVQTVACCPSNTVVGEPADQRLINASLINQVLNEASDGVINECRHYR